MTNWLLTDELLKGFLNCSRHCWCAYSEDDPVIERLGAKVIVKGFKAIPHEHGMDPDKCMGCLREAGKLQIV